MTKAIFLDIDGTLVPFGSHGISATTISTLNKLQRNGMKLIIATGRHIDMIDNVDGIDFDAYVTLNGSVCFGNDRKTVLNSRCIPKEDIISIAAFSKKYSFPLVVMPVKGHLFTTAKDEYFIKATELLHLPEIEIGPIEAAIDQDIAQMMVFGAKDAIASSHLFEESMPNCEPTSWNELFSDIIPRGSDKSHGIVRICEYFGMDISETMAFGDGINDKGMIAHAGIGIAMGNAPDSVKSVADYISADAKDDGIITALKHFGLV